MVRRFAGPLARALRAAALGGALLAGTTAKAQYVYEEEILPPRAVAWRLSERGFTGIARPRFDGRNYRVEAFDPRGDRVLLIVAAEDGAILGRRRLDAPALVARPPRPAPGYGWTEDDVRPRPALREAERLVPPADIPLSEERGAYAARPLPPVPPRGPDAPRRETAAADPAGNPLGLNPDAAGRSAAPPRRVARVAPSGEKAAGPRLSDVKPAARAVPEAPRPTAGEAKADAPKGPAMPAAQTPKPDAPETRAADLRPADRPVDKPADGAWKDPPEAKRNVRVIGGATIVPGTSDKDGGAAPAAN